MRVLCNVLLRACTQLKARQMHTHEVISTKYTLQHAQCQDTRTDSLLLSKKQHQSMYCCSAEQAERANTSARVLYYYAVVTI
eukprot:14249-Heterococcus_DN1.PRE.2